MTIWFPPTTVPLTNFNPLHGVIFWVSLSVEELFLLASLQGVSFATKFSGSLPHQHGTTAVSLEITPFIGQ